MPYITRRDDISALPLSARSQNCLRRADIHTVGAMMDYPMDKLTSIHNMGKKSAEEICQLVRTLLNGNSEYELINANEATDGQPANSDGCSITIFLDETGTVVQDIPISELQLSVRAKNSLIRSGYDFASQLIGKTYNKLIEIPNMGKKTAEEVWTYVEKITLHHSSVAAADDVSFPDQTVASELSASYGGGENIWLREIVAIKLQFPEVRGETLIYSFSNEIVSTAIPLKPASASGSFLPILRYLEENYEKDVSLKKIADQFHLNAS